jgi:ABC-type transporter Mla maintaining outer membrane lipid asymmetry ATPase subunit MlaF
MLRPNLSKNDGCASETAFKTCVKSAPVRGNECPGYYESERVIQQNMKQIATGRTVFVIAHRLSTVRNSDRIITIERGRIVEDGTHDELIRSNGRYAKLHYLQAGIHDIR